MTKKYEELKDDRIGDYGMSYITANSEGEVYRTTLPFSGVYDMTASFWIKYNNSNLFLISWNGKRSRLHFVPGQGFWLYDQDGGYQIRWQMPTYNVWVHVVVRSPVPASTPTCHYDGIEMQPISTPISFSADMEIGDASRFNGAGVGDIRIEKNVA